MPPKSAASSSKSSKDKQAAVADAKRPVHKSKEDETISTVRSVLVALATGVVAYLAFKYINGTPESSSPRQAITPSVSSSLSSSTTSTPSVSSKASTSSSRPDEQPTEKQGEEEAETKATEIKWPTWAPPHQDLYRVLPDFDDAHNVKITTDERRRNEIKEAFVDSWKAYEDNAWGYDEYHPLSKSGSYLGKDDQGMGYMIVDCLDSLLLFGLDAQYERARDWVRDELTFDVKGKVNGFETIIRILGGLLSAYHLTSTHQNPNYHADAAIYLEKAVDLGERLLPLFHDSPTAIPYSFIDLVERKAYPDADNNGFSSLAEAGSLQLEFKYLSEISGDPTYAKLAESVIAAIRPELSAEGVAPILVNPRNAKFVASDIRLGSRGDSYYEYLLKQWLQTNRTEPLYKEMYDQAMHGVEKLLMNKSPRQGLIYTHELSPQRDPSGQAAWVIIPKQDHLVCFLGGSFLLGVAAEYPDFKPIWSQMKLDQQIGYIAGAGLISTCADLYRESETGLAAEIVMFRWKEDIKDARDTRDWYVKRGPNDTPILDGRNILRPETVESLFLAYRLTGDRLYREQGWQIFQSFQKHCKVPGGGYAGIANVEDADDVEQLDKMETFWLSETLKYLYLLFSDGDTVPLSDNVFNTEAHILPVYTPQL